MIPKLFHYFIYASRHFSNQLTSGLKIKIPLHKFLHIKLILDAKVKLNNNIIVLLGMEEKAKSVFIWLDGECF